MRESRPFDNTRRRWPTSWSKSSSPLILEADSQLRNMFDLPTPADDAKLPSMVGAIIYIRVSTKEQTENLSLPTQLRVCEEYCRRQGYEILERFFEEGESAKTTDRSRLQHLLTFTRRGGQWFESTSAHQLN